ncbi:DUF4861 family protein [Flavobacterium hydatis]|uniref:DUF4861 domain-containing protein n=1 Tax=Flavobacterium hydatis TaxID=991 RepID=A0A086A7A5_FLAHY|nr:DUF4861 family protein [Flavobacterium hydatis]KFF12569.1 hypothetical protein IW20_18455 [Flavobacterium hydatis]OXA86800.1 DUF4861 domain-containing protein [Flavobacterium hydatis]
MKLIKLFLCLAFISPLGILAQTKATITIQNNSAQERKEAVIAIKWETILSHYPQIDTTNFVVINQATKKQIPFQLEHRGLSSIQNLLVQINAKAKASVILIIQKGKPETFATKTYARYVPERKDDFAWENDKIAFRAYGKAIENTKEDASGFDVWVKRIDKMVINERYKIGNYHIDSGNGMDYYHVGATLGAGNMAPYVNDSICYSGNYRKWLVLDNGPLRSTFQLTYDTWIAGGITVKATKIISIDAGSQLNRVENTYTFDGNKPMEVVVGLSKKPEAGVISLNEQQGIMGYWEPTFGQDGTTGVGSILTTPVKNMWVDKTQILAKTTVTNNEPIVYYTGAAWNKAGKITDAKQWFTYLDNFHQQIKNPLIIKVE